MNLKKIIFLSVTLFLALPACATDTQEISTAPQSIKGSHRSAAYRTIALYHFNRAIGLSKKPPVILGTIGSFLASIVLTAAYVYKKRTADLTLKSQIISNPNPFPIIEADESDIR